MIDLYLKLVFKPFHITTYTDINLERVGQDKFPVDIDAFIFITCYRYFAAKFDKCRSLARAVKGMSDNWMEGLT